jgi:hypothetical protein
MPFLGDFFQQNPVYEEEHWTSFELPSCKKIAKKENLKDPTRIKSNWQKKQGTSHKAQTPSLKH